MKQHLTLLKNARIIDCESKTVRNLDMLYKSAGEILEISESIDPRSLESTTLTTIDAESNLVCPRFVDLLCRLREPGLKYKGTIDGALMSAYCGGYGTLLAMPENSRLSASDVIAYLKPYAHRGRCAVLVASPLTDSDGNETDIDLLHSLGAAAFTDDREYITDSASLKRIMIKCKEKGYTLILSASDSSFNGGSVNDGAISDMMKCLGIPASAELLAVARALILAGETGCRIHISHISTAGAVSMIRDAKRNGIGVTCDVAPHHFSFSENDILFYGNAAKTLPPLRSDADREAILFALSDGTIDCIATDHSPNAADELEKSLADAPFGMTGLQTAFPAAVSNLLDTGKIDVFRLCELLSINPARVLGLDVTLRPGNPADFNIISLTETTTVTPEFLKSKAKNTAFMGMTLRGKIIRSVAEGR